RNVPVVLPSEGVGLVEGDRVAALRERADDAAVIGRGSVPVGRHEARAEERDLQEGLPSEASRSTISRSSSARCAQVCRARTVSPKAAKPSGTAWFGSQPAYSMPAAARAERPASG